MTIAELFRGTTQLIVVTTPDWNAVDGRLQRYQRSDDHHAWQPVGAAIPIVVGRHGLGWGRGLLAWPGSADEPMKQEGDGRSPAGLFALGTAFGYAPQKIAGSLMPYLALTATTECVDDVRSASYNRIVDRAAIPVDWTSSEHMREAGVSYRWGLVVDHNRIAPQPDRPLPGSGSCIFLHIWKGAGQGTAGCTAMPQRDIETLLRWLDPRQRPLLVQLTAADYARLMKEWTLPTVSGLPAR